MTENIVNLAAPQGLLLPERRLLMRAAAAAPMALGGSLLPGLSLAQGWQGDGFWSQPRSVWLRRPANGDEIKSTYWADGRLIESEYYRLCWFMRDLRMEARMEAHRRAGVPVPKDWYCAAAMSLVLLDILYATGAWLRYFGLDRAILLTSGLRHVLTNSQTEGAAKNGHHTKAGAGDIIIPDVSADSVFRFGAWLGAGGVGWYPSKGFTHVDDGRLRVWKG